MFLQLYIYNDNKNIYSSCKNLNEKKNVSAFLIKKTPLYAGLGSKLQNFQQLPSNLLERNVCCLKTQGVFFTKQTCR